MELNEIEKFILGKLPKSCQVTNVDFEGPEIILYTKNPAAFFDSKENHLGKIAFELKKKITLRSDKSLLMDPSDAKKAIEAMVPPDAEVKNITFVDSFCQVVIEATKPGLVIGKGGETSKAIITKTGWTPKILRAPTSNSEFLQGIRYHLNKHASERKKFLQETAKKIYRTQTAKHDWVRLTGLGAFREVGRSCMMVDTPITKLLMDCGINAARPDDPYPYLDALYFPLSELDALIISHAHMDHQGFAPYLYRMGYRGPLYCTEPTRDLMGLLQFDFVDLCVKEGKEPPYTEKDIKEELKHVIVRDYREVTDISPDMKLTFFNASHILGSASVHLHVGDGLHNLVYSGDYKYGFTRLFDTMDIGYPRVETLITESTYGGETDIMPARDDAERKLLRIIQETFEQGGNVLIPVFAVGRGQEVMLVIEEFYRQGLLPDAKVYIDGLTKEASAIHTAYPEYLRQTVQRRIFSNDSPFTSPLFHQVTAKDREEILKDGRVIILASSGMLNGGASLDYFYRMVENEKNTLIFAGWQGEGSLGRKLQAGIKEIPVADTKGKTRMLKINMRIENQEGFSVPYETEVFIKRHGEFGLTQIGKLSDEHFDEKEEGIGELQNIFVPAFDANGKMELHAASHIIKHKTTHGHLFIKTKSGRSVQASKGHSVFVLREGEVKTLQTKELKIGDYLVIPGKVPESHTLTQVALTKFVENKNYQIHGEVFKPIKGGNFRIPEEEQFFLKVNCDDMKSLAKFLGYYIAEGHIDYGKCNRPTLSFNANEENTLVKDTIECVGKAFGLKCSIFRPHGTEIQVRINNTLLAEFLEKIGVGKGAKNKRVPNLIYNLSIENQTEFLKAYFAGDGYHYKNGSIGYRAAKTASKQLVSDLAYLLLQQGISSKIKGPFVEKARMLKGQYLKESIAYKIYFTESDYQKVGHQIGYLPFALPIHEMRLNELIPLIKDVKLKQLARIYVRNYRTKGRQLIGRELLRKMFSNAESNQKEFLTLCKFLNGDLRVDEIIELTEKEMPEFEYDLSVPGVENFVGGRGGVCLHNSGHSDFLQLQNYVRNITPRPKRIIVDHGDKNITVRFAKHLTNKFGIKSVAIRNLDTIRLR